jgi:hypothetical protein
MAHVVELAEWLNDEEYFGSPQDVVVFFWKPWHYAREWQIYLLWQASEDNQPLRDACLDALDDDDRTVADLLAEFETAESE